MGLLYTLVKFVDLFGDAVSRDVTDVTHPLVITGVWPTAEFIYNFFLMYPQFDAVLHIFDVEWIKLISTRVFPVININKSTFIKWIVDFLHTQNLW